MSYTDLYVLWPSLIAVVYQKLRRLPKGDAVKLTRRKAAAINAYIFPGSGAGGYIVESRKQMAKATEANGVAFTVHDLRRTFVAVAESLDIPAYALKCLLDHADVAAGYIVANVERLREPMQKITDYLLKAAGIKATAEVIQLKILARNL